MPVSAKKSVLFFSVHKSATSFLSRYLEDVAVHSQRTYVDYNGYFFTQGRTSLARQHNTRFLKKVFREEGYLYGPLRYLLPVDNLQNYLVVLFLRDPRDVLTSHYFSIKYSHPLNTATMIKKRKAARLLSIDEFVRTESERFLKTYTEYCQQLLPKENLLLLRYEEMIVDFPGFLKKLAEHIGANFSVDQLSVLDRTSEFLNTEENVLRHKRKVTAGDHRVKLKPETIAWLDEKFADVLQKLGYANSHP